MQMTRSKCKKCDWIFDVVSAPMPVTDWCRALKGSCCPMCGNRAGNTLAQERPLTDAEIAHKHKIMPDIAA